MGVKLYSGQHETVGSFPGANPESFVASNDPTRHSHDLAILAWWTSTGLTPEMECTGTVMSALREIGRSYRQAEELTPAGTDCSTLVSQAHWAASAVATPFTAQGQAMATTCTRGLRRRTLLPGDVLVRFPRGTVEPGGNNHVSMYVGENDDGVGWIIEAVPDRGVDLRPLRPADADGGARRFHPHPLVEFDREAVDTARCLAVRVPKLGRLGAMQYTTLGHRIRHTGVDIYSPVGTTVYAPCDGVLWHGAPTPEANYVTTIRTAGLDFAVRLANVRSDLQNGCAVTRTEPIGELLPPRCPSPIAYASSHGGVHLHIELHGAPKSSPDPRVAWCARNFLYRVKDGTFASPIDVTRL